MAVVAAISGYRLSLLSIAAGFLVGKAMRIGSAGRGSRTLQVLAALLTYVAVTGSYFPPSGNVADFITCLAIPFFQIASGMQGLLGIFILAVGMAQAWRMMAHPKLPITGPHTVQL